MINLNELDNDYIRNLSYTIEKIRKTYLLKKSTAMELSLPETNKYRVKEDLEVGLSLLKQDKIVLNFFSHVFGSAGDYFQVEIDLEKFNKFKDKFNEWNSNQACEENDEPVFRLDFDDMSGRIKINNETIRKANIDSSTDRLFKVLMSKNIVTKDDLPDIDFKKTIDNLNFGSFKDVFFRVSKSKIQFNNPIYVKDIKRLDLNVENLTRELDKLHKSNK